MSSTRISDKHVPNEPNTLCSLLTLPFVPKGIRTPNKWRISGTPPPVDRFPNTDTQTHQLFATWRSALSLPAKSSRIREKPPSPTNTEHRHVPAPPFGYTHPSTDRMPQTFGDYSALASTQCKPLAHLQKKTQLYLCGRARKRKIATPPQRAALRDYGTHEQGSYPQQVVKGYQRHRDTSRIQTSGTKTARSNCPHSRTTSGYHTSTHAHVGHGVPTIRHSTELAGTIDVRDSRDKSLAYS